METRRANSNALSKLDVEGKIMKNDRAYLRRVVKIFILILAKKFIPVNSELKGFPHGDHRYLVGHAAGRFQFLLLPVHVQYRCILGYVPDCTRMILKTLCITDYEAHLLPCISNSLKILTHHKIIVQNSTAIFNENPVLPAPTEGP